jgi:hypothetical protein
MLGLPPARYPVQAPPSAIWGLQAIVIEDQKQAVDILDKALIISRKLAQLSPNDEWRAESLASDLYNLANTKLDDNTIVNNIAQATGHCAEIQALRTGHPRGFSQRFDVLALWVCGKVADRSGDKQLGRTLILSAIDIGRKKLTVPLQITYVGVLVSWMGMVSNAEARTYTDELRHAVADLTDLPKEQHSEEMTYNTDDANKLLAKLK